MPSIVELDKDNNIIMPEKPKQNDKKDRISASNTNYDAYSNNPQQKMLILEDEHGNEITRIVPAVKQQQQQSQQQQQQSQPQQQQQQQQSQFQQNYLFHTAPQQNPLFVQPQIIPTYFMPPVWPEPQLQPQPFFYQKSAPTFVNDNNSYKKTSIQPFVNTKKLKNKS